MTDKPSYPRRLPKIETEILSNSPDDIDAQQWLEEIGLEQYTETLLANLSYDGKIILRRRLRLIRRQDLSMMGIQRLDHQKLLMDHIYLALHLSFNSPIRKKEVALHSPVKKPFDGDTQTNSPGPRIMNLNRRLFGPHTYGTAPPRTAPSSSSRIVPRTVIAPKDILAERRKKATRRRSFDESIWKSITTMRQPNTKESKEAIKQLKEGAFSQDINDYTRKSKSRGRRWSYEDQAKIAETERAMASIKELEKQSNYSSISRSLAKINSSN